MLGGAIQTIGSLTRRLTVSGYAYGAIGVAATSRNAYSRSAVIVIAVTAVLALLWLDDLRFHLGWSAVPVFLWAAAAVAILNIAPQLLKLYWRQAFSITVLGLAVVGVLGSLQLPNYFYTDTTINQSYGGSFGNYLARWPAEWADSGGTSGQVAVALLRTGVLVLIAAAGTSPRHALTALRAIGSGLATLGALLVIAGAGLASRISAWRAARAASRPTAEDLMNGSAALGTEADQIEHPSFTTDGREPPLAGNVRPDLLVAEDGPAEDADPDARIVVADVETPVNDEDDAPDDDAVLDGDPGLLAPVLPGFLHVPPFAWPLPDVGMLKVAPAGGVPESELEATSELIVETLADHGIEVSVGDVRVGPRVTMYGIVPGWGRGRGSQKLVSEQAADGARESGRKRVRVDNILAREKDLALSLASPSLRFEAPVPGASLVGIEVPNSRPTPVTLRTVIESDAYEKFASDAPLPVPLGVGSGGENVVIDLARMPHLLVAGATGSGKSVCMNTIATGLLMNRTPEQVRIVMIDPKRVELTPYTGVPHLYAPPVVEPDVAVGILKALVEEMSERFKVLERAGVRNIVAYNEGAATKMPYLVIMVDELADLMLTSASEVERLLCRLAQLGRATGIHLIIATQRPSVDVVTGLIKANFPSRISFSVTSQIDSRTIIDGPGAEKLLGKGDMLFLPIDRPKPLRIQGAFLGDPEVASVVDFWKTVDGPKMPGIEPLTASADTGDFGDGGHDGDSLFDRASEMAGAHKTLSVSLLQRRLRIGYPRAARLMDELEEAGVVGMGEPGKPRPVL
ncbi:MAG: DNA translocase FtsK [Dehalococcoidia bacterium]|jgi:S-DNA-T family DNA segregation ATPase FtsK/SpoIIIE|nr:DNA translocase FtsK [Dehalococcoidia bacterium]